MILKKPNIYNSEIVKLHEKNNGLLEMEPKFKVKNKFDLGKAYTPGVATISKVIKKYPTLKNRLTLSGKLVAVITDGSAILGLGNVGTKAGLPIVEGKALLYKELGDINALPLTLRQVNVDDFVNSIKNISSSFAGIHLEDIAAPRCFAIEEKLNQELDIPVYHDDQEGTAIVVLAGLINAAKVVGKKLQNLKVVINGIGASGQATAQLLKNIGITNITLVDKKGVIKPTSNNYNRYQTGLAKQIGFKTKGETLDDVIGGKDVFIGLSVSDILSGQQVAKMASKPIVFALANPKPEIDPKTAQLFGASIVATGSSQYNNQINNILVFPGLFRGLLKSGLKNLDFPVQRIAAQALANMISYPTAKKIIPGVFDSGVVSTIADSILNFIKRF